MLHPRHENVAMVPDMLAQGIAKLRPSSQILNAHDPRLRFVGSMTIGADSRGPAQRLTAFEEFMKTLAVSDLRTSIMRAVVPGGAQYGHPFEYGRARRRTNKYPHLFFDFSKN